MAPLCGRRDEHIDLGPPSNSVGEPTKACFKQTLEPFLASARRDFLSIFQKAELAIATQIC
jgi:hypothetical protein